MASSSLPSRHLIPITEFLEKMELSVPISETQIGLVIGRGGATIKAMETTCGAKMWVCQDGCVKISGEKAHVKAGEKLLNKLLERKTFRVTVSPAEIPKVIGRVGAMISTMQLRSGAKMSVDQKQCQVIIMGNKSQINMAVRMLNDVRGKHDDIPFPKEEKDNVEKGPIGLAELTLNRNKLKLTNVDSSTKELDILKLFPDSKVIPKILMRDGEATLMFANPTEAKVWASKINECILINRQIVKKTSKTK